jgi:thiamine pyrophosphokinase
MVDANQSVDVRSVRALVFAGGDPLPRGVAHVLPEHALVLAADSGIDHAHAIGRRVDVAIGDFDSVTPDGLERAEREGARIERHPTDKDATDLELAIDAAIAAGIARVTVVGGHGGRLDHLLGNLVLLAAPTTERLELDAWMGAAHVTVVRTRATLAGTAGSIVSLFAMHGPARGVTTHGLRFPLHDAALEPGSTLGLSNEIAATDAAVTLTTGVLLAVQPDALPLTDAPPSTGGH